MVCNCRRVAAATRNLLTFYLTCDSFTPNVRLVCRRNYSVTSLQQVWWQRLLFMTLLSVIFYLSGWSSISYAVPVLVYFSVQCTFSCQNSRLSWFCASILAFSKAVIIQWFCVCMDMQRMLVEFLQTLWSCGFSTHQWGWMWAQDS